MSTSRTERRYDMHVHSTNSDGLLSPDEVLGLAGGRLAGFCFTDHSGITYDQRLVDLAGEQGTALLFPGVEISTVHDGNKYHVLAYGKGLLETDFGHFAGHPTRVKNEVYTEVVGELRRSGIPLPEVATMLAGGRAGQPEQHPTKWMLSTTLIASYLTDHGFSAEEARTVLTRRYDELKDNFPDRYLPTLETVRRVRDFGGFPVIAHPWWECPSGRNTPRRLRAVLGDLRKAGLLGLEVSTRHSTVGTEQFRRSVAAEIDLVPFAGSDFHANGKTELGQFTLDDAEFATVMETAMAHGCTL